MTRTLKTFILLCLLLLGAIGGAGAQTPATILADSAYAGAVKTNTIDANRTAPSGQFTHEYLLSGPAFANLNTFTWDVMIGTLVAQQLNAQGAATYTAAQQEGWLQNFIDTQPASGEIYNGVAANPANSFTTQSFVPVLSYITLKTFTVNGSTDTAWLTTMYAGLKKWNTWFDTNRKDANGLYTWGYDTTPGNNSWAALESGEDNAGPFNDQAYTSLVSGKRYMSHSSPDLCGYIVMDDDSLSKIATLLGNSTDATSYAAKRDALKAAMNAYQWDDQQGCYQMCAMSDLAKAAGTCAAAITGATSLTLTSSSALSLHSGEKLQIGTLTCQAGSDVYLPATTPTSVPLVRGLSAAVTTGAAVSALEMCYVKELAFHTVPLWAGVPAPLQAGRIVLEHVNKTLGGAEAESASFTYANSFYKGYAAQRRFVSWFPNYDSLTSIFTPRGIDLSDITSGAGATAYYRDSSDSVRRPNMYYDGTSELFDATHPLTVSARWIQGSPSIQVELLNVAGGDSINGIEVLNGATPIYQINCGGAAAAPYAADSAYTVGAQLGYSPTYTNVSGGAVNTTGTYTSTAAVDTSGVTAGGFTPAPQAVYQSSRYGNGAGSARMFYQFTGLTEGGTYSVRLHFNEQYYSASGGRLQNVNINGVRVLTNYDIYATAGAKNKANVQVFSAVATTPKPLISVLDPVPTNAVLTTQTLTSAAAPGAVATGSVSLTSYPSVGGVAISSSGGGILEVQNFTLTTKPRGFVYRTPNGILTAPRFGEYFVNKANPASGDESYWTSSSWATLDYFTALGLARYGYNGSARAIAAQSAMRGYNNSKTFSAYSEFFNAAGAGRGYSPYVWAGLPLVLSAFYNSLPAFGDVAQFRSRSLSGSRPGSRTAN